MVVTELSRAQTSRKNIIPFRSSIERGLEYYAWHLYEDRNFLDTLTAN
jgi:hypothetical protein